MSAELDVIDKNIIRLICEGIYSYTELADQSGVSRKTITKRLERLENERIIEKKIMAIPNFGKLGLSAVCVGLEIEPSHVDKTVVILKDQPRVKFIWRTYGTYNVIVVFICSKGEEGQCINNLRLFLDKAGIRIPRIALSVSYSWDKVDLNPF